MLKLLMCKTLIIEFLYLVNILYVAWIDLFLRYISHSLLHEQRKYWVMSRIYDSLEPSVISEEMLLTAVEEQGAKDEKGKMTKHNGIELDEVKSLRLDYKSKWTFRYLIQNKILY